MKKLILLIILCTFAFLISSCMNEKTKIAFNKQIVTNFYELAFNEHRPQEAIERYVGDKYIQHNPKAADGKQAFIDYFKPYFEKNKDTFIEIKRVMAEGDLVMVHIHSRLNKNDRGRAVIDIFRVENRKIVEHWDVGQKIPEKMAHNNTMF